jgi:isopenicillin N synthase-like dioxygenase
VESLESGYSDQFGGPFPRAATGYPGGDSLLQACAALQTALHATVLAPCLAIASAALEMAEGELAARWLAEGETAAQLRLARYRPVPGPGPQLLYGEHTDYDGFTFLWRSQTNGLQAWLGDAWTEVPLLPHAPDALLVNLGDLMELWTRGVWHSPRHRVLRTSAPPPGSEGGLVSIVWFVGPHPTTRLAALPSPLLPGGQAGPALTAGEHVRGKIDKTAQ